MLQSQVSLSAARARDSEILEKLGRVQKAFDGFQGFRFKLCLAFPNACKYSIYTNYSIVKCYHSEYLGGPGKIYRAMVV